MENNWKSKTLENLEKDIWKNPDNESHLVTTCHKLRKKQLKEYDIEDCRIMISQEIGLKYVVPIALEFLNENILAEGDFYEGDLLNAISEVNKTYWIENNDLLKVLYLKVKQQGIKLKEHNKGLYKKVSSMFEELIVV
ncbi:MAG: hypothetical protein KJ941_11560 [Bacteroidetes bacterium]|nr:hypothetical protein [Bacteroidota bacterium]